jgi:hypothetical protein
MSASTTPGADLPASLLKRVAEAASGLRNGRPVWFVVKKAFPHRLRRHYSEAEADADLAARGSTNVKLGPYMTPNDTPQKAEISSITVRMKDGREYTFEPERVDALFFSLSALDKFFYPYYTALYGPEKAAEKRRRYTDPANTSSITCHDPVSDECDDPPPNGP